MIVLLHCITASGQHCTLARTGRRRTPTHNSHIDGVGEQWREKVLDRARLLDPASPGRVSGKRMPEKHSGCLMHGDTANYTDRTRALLDPELEWPVTASQQCRAGHVSDASHSKSLGIRRTHFHHQPRKCARALCVSLESCEPRPQHRRCWDGAAALPAARKLPPVHRVLGAVCQQPRRLRYFHELAIAPRSRWG